MNSEYNICELYRHEYNYYASLKKLLLASTDLLRVLIKLPNDPRIMQAFEKLILCLPKVSHGDSLIFLDQIQIIYSPQLYTTKQRILALISMLTLIVESLETNTVNEFSDARYFSDWCAQCQFPHGDELTGCC